MKGGTAGYVAIALIVGFTLGIIFVGLSLHYNASEQSLLKGWHSLVGAIIAAATTGSAVVFTAAHTRRLFFAQEKAKRTSETEKRNDEIRRELTVLYMAIDRDYKALIQCEVFVRKALEGKDEHIRFLNFVSGLQTWEYGSEQLIEAGISKLGDIDIAPLHILVGYHVTSLNARRGLRRTKDVKAEKLEEGTTKGLVESTLLLIRQLRTVNVMLQIGIEEYFASKKFPPINTDWALKLNEKHRERRKQANAPVDVVAWQKRAIAAAAKFE